MEDEGTFSSEFLPDLPLLSSCCGRADRLPCVAFFGSLQSAREEWPHNFVRRPSRLDGLTSGNPSDLSQLGHEYVTASPLRSVAFSEEACFIRIAELLFITGLSFSESQSQTFRQRVRFPRTLNAGYG
jgi:hypothetical protein